MGYTTRNKGQIKDFWPDDTDTEFYLTSDQLLSDIIDLCREKWPDCDIRSITITPERIHTFCLTYDLYDSGDYTDFIKITLLK